MRVITAVIAIASGIFVLLGYFFPDQLDVLRLTLVNWAIIIAGMAVLVGIFNLVAVQMEKLRARQKGSAYGGLLVISLVVTFLGFGLWVGPEAPSMRFVVNAIVVPVEASLMAILAITLIYASIRLLRRRVDVMSMGFLIAAVVFLILSMPTPFSAITPAQDFVAQIARMFSSGGARGLLIGIALGVLLTGLRVLFGVDRPYGGN